MNHSTSEKGRPTCGRPSPFQEWRETCATLHMWTQIVGKVRPAQS